MTTAHIGIDLGTSRTVTVAASADGRYRPLYFEDSYAMPSAVYLDHDGDTLVGRDAVRAGKRHPERLELNPKQRIDEESLLLGDDTLPLTDALAALLTTAHTEATRLLNTNPTCTLTVPASWGITRISTLEHAAYQAGLDTITTIAEPVAAAHYFTTVLEKDLPLGSTLLIYDLGAGTFDATAVKRTPDGLTVTALDGLDTVGGLDIDEAIIDHLHNQHQNHPQWHRLTHPTTPDDHRARHQLRDDVREAKEQLSRQQTATINLPLLAATTHLTRTELDTITQPLIAKTMRVTKTVMDQTDLTPRTTAGIFLVGGASRMPLIATTLHRELGITPTSIEQPELAVAEGAARLHTSPPKPAPTPMPPPTTPLPAAPTQKPRPKTPLIVTAIALTFALIATLAITNWPSSDSEATLGPTNSPTSTPEATTPDSQTSIDLTLATSIDNDDYHDLLAGILNLDTPDLTITHSGANNATEVLNRLADNDIQLGTIDPNTSYDHHRDPTQAPDNITTLGYVNPRVYFIVTPDEDLTEFTELDGHTIGHQFSDGSYRDELIHDLLTAHDHEPGTDVTIRSNMDLDDPGDDIDAALVTASSPDYEFRVDSSLHLLTPDADAIETLASNYDGLTAIDFDLGSDGETHQITTFTDWTTLVATTDLDHDHAEALINTLDQNANTLLAHEGPYLAQYSPDAGYDAYPPHPALDEHRDN